MATSGSFESNYYDGERGISFSWSLADQSISGNYSVINWSVQGCGGSGSNYYMAGAFSASINGSTVLSSGDRRQLWNGTGIGSGQFTIGHNSAGQGSFSAYIEAGIGTYAVSVSGSGSWDLPTIPRTSNVSVSTGSVPLNGTSFTVYTNRKSSSFYHTIRCSCSGWSAVAYGIGDSCSFTPSGDIYNSIGNGSTTISVYCDTYSGSSWIGASSSSLQVYSVGVAQSSLSTGSITLNGSNGVRIYTNRRYGGFNHKIYQNLGTSGWNPIQEGVSDYADWTPGNDYYNNMGQSGSIGCTILVQTFYGSTYIGASQCGFTLYSVGPDSISINGNMVIGNSYTASMSTKISGFQHRVYFGFGSAGWELKGTGAYNTVLWENITTELAKQITTSRSGTGTIYCETRYNGSTYIGTSSCNFNLSVPNYLPTLNGSPTITEYGKDNSNKLNGAAAIALKQYGVDDSTIIAIMSKKTISISAHSEYYGYISSITFSLGGTTITRSFGTTESNNVSITADFSDGTKFVNGNLIIYATDSRGITTSTYAKSLTYIQYIKPTISYFTGDRTNAETASGTLKLGGKTFYGKVGTTLNGLKYTIVSDPDSGIYPETSVSPVSGNSWSSTIEMPNVPINTVFNFALTLVDTFGYYTTASFTLSVSKPTLWLGRNTVKINGDLVINDEKLIDLVYPVTSLAVGKYPTLGGTWTSVGTATLGSETVTVWKRTA